LRTTPLILRHRSYLIAEYRITCLKAYHGDLVTLFQPEKGRLPSYSTIRRALLRTEYQAYAACLARFFGIQPLPGKTIAMDGKLLRGSYEAISDDEAVNSHPAIMLTILDTFGKILIYGYTSCTSR
jgi:hypothetical protein